MKNVPLLIGTLVGTLAIVIGLAVVFSKPEPAKIVDTSVLVKDDRPTKGTKGAKVTVVEFSDLQCPSCKAAEPEVLRVLAQYPKDVYFIYRHFPLPTVHQHAQAAAQAAEAAKTVNKFWEMHDLLFATQSEWENLDEPAFNKKLEEYVQKLAIDKSDFQKKMNSKEIKDAVAADVSDGTRAGVDGTPTFFVNGQLTSAPQLFSTVESALSVNK